MPGEGEAAGPVSVLAFMHAFTRQWKIENGNYFARFRREENEIFVHCSSPHHRSVAHPIDEASCRPPRLQSDDDEGGRGTTKSPKRDASESEKIF